MKIKELLDKPEKWTKGALALNALGQATRTTDPKAVCWCLEGALDRCYSDEDCIKVRQKIRSEIGNIPGFCNSIPDFNDNPSTTFADIMALVEKLDI